VFVVALAAGCSSKPETAASTAVSGSLPAGATAAPTAGTDSTATGTATSSPNSVRITDDLTASEIASQLTSLERAAAQGDGSAGQRQQLLYRYLSANSNFDVAVLEAVGADVHPFIERIVRARQLGQARSAANTITTPPSETLPAWRVVEPLPVDELLGDYNDAEAATGIPWYWLAAIHLQETRMGRIIGTSSAGAVGPMQFLPETWSRCCVGDPMVARDAILGAATYLLQSGGNTDIQVALQTYNPNEGYVATVTAFAENMRDNPKLYNAYRDWQVFYSSAAGTVRLPIGYDQLQPVAAAAYVAEHPEDLAD
jgi:membrane-bound lytic murein transglycosylase B